MTVAEGATRIEILSEVDIVTARQRAREVAEAIGFTGADLTLIATAVSELARNIVQHAGHGEILVAAASENGRTGLWMVARDNGPGIVDVELALRDGYSTAGSLGLGLPGARRLMDELEITSTDGSGTVVEARKWLR